MSKTGDSPEFEAKMKEIGEKTAHMLLPRRPFNEPLPEVRFAPEPEPEPAQPARPVYALDAPASMFRLTTVARALKVLHGPDLVMVSDEAQYVWYTPGEPCNCDECTDYLLRMIEGSHA